ncbi:hypothetical protein AB0940_02435 [Streptomyces sp. NPDC006656]|uniref:hypothetical protein n=1 Tax=Streptomyces sp. NPDC006656 TaxID=3156899 RepID=UPI0034544CCA
MPEPTGRSFEIEAIRLFSRIRAASDRLGLFLHLGGEWPRADWSRPGLRMWHRGPQRACRVGQRCAEVGEFGVEVAHRRRLPEPAAPV